MNEIDKYIKNSTWLVKENANSSYSISGLMNYLAENEVKKYILEHIYPNKISEAHKKGYYHLNDLGHGLTVYCVGHDLKTLLHKGFNGVAGKIACGPPKHLRSAVNQMVNFLFTAQTECYHKDTKVLTKNGYKKFSDVSYSDSIATLNPTTMELEYQKPTAIIKKKSKELIEFKNKKHHIITTPNHDFFGTANLGNINYKKIKAKDINNIYIPNKCNWKGKETKTFILPEIKVKKYSPFAGYYDVTLPSISMDMQVWINFLALYLTEGNIYSGKKIDRRRNQIKEENYVQISQNKFIPEFNEVLKNTPFKYKYYNNKNGCSYFRIYSKQLTYYLKQFGKSGDKFIPKYIKELSKEQLTDFYKYLKLGDGLTDTSNGNEYYYSKSLQMAEDVQEIMLKLGNTANIYKRSNHLGEWYVTSMSKANHSHLNKNHSTIIPYNDYVYCVTVPNGIIHINYKGKTNWCGNCAGAQAFSNIDTLLAPYVRIDNLNYHDIKQCMQELIYPLNVPNRSGMQAPFSNVTLDIECPKMFKEEKPIINGREMDFTYGDCGKEIGQISQAFFEILSKGDYNERPFTFPIPTVNLHENINWTSPYFKTIFEVTAKYGTPTFQNFINSDLDPQDTYSLCCRLRLEKRELLSNSGGTFGSNPNTGSIGVVTLNMSRLAYEIKQTNKDKKGILEEYKNIIKKYMDLAKESLEIKRVLIDKNLSIGLMPYIKTAIPNFNNHFSTIAIVGMNEGCLNLIGKSIDTTEGIELTDKVLEYMREIISEYQEETGNLYNLEQAPAEGSSFRLASIDKKIYPNIITAGTEESPYYTNSTHLPVNHDKNIFDIIKIQDKFNEHYNGGTVVHFFLGERISDWINTMILVRKIAENSKLPYFTITPTFTICPVHGYISGEHEFCPLDHTEEDLKKYGVLIENDEKNTM